MRKQPEDTTIMYSPGFGNNESLLVRDPENVGVSIFELKGC